MQMLYNDDGLYAIMHGYQVNDAAKEKGTEMSNYVGPS